MTAALLVALTAFGGAATALTTVAETSHWQRTGRYEEVGRLCHAFAAADKRVRCQSFGTTPEGRPMWVLSVGPAGAPTMLFQGGIHAGEIDGKDAGFEFLRDFLDGKVVDRAAAAKLRLVFVPVFNADGHERFGAHNRPNQVGPAESGWRVTAQNINLNRDYVKADAPEMHAMLALLAKEDPTVYVDLHVTDGAKFQPDVAVLIQPDEPDTAPALASATKALRATLLADLTKAGHLPLVDFYPQFVRDDDPASGFATSPSPPRFSQGYWAMRNRFGVLVETHSWKDYATRVRATYDTLAILTRELAAHGAAWQAAGRAADADAAAGAFAGRPLVLGWRADETKHTPLDFPGYAYVRESSPISGKTRIRYDDTKPEVWHIPFFGSVVPTATVTLPQAGWWIPAAWVPLIGPRLEAHGIVTVRGDGGGTEREVERFHADKVDRAAGSFEGRAVMTVRGHREREKRPLGAGLFVPVKQARARLAAQMLEPEATDSLASWGLFATVFERKEYMEDYVLEDVAAQMMTDPAIKREFEARLAKDPEFARSPRQRLDFFYRRHPSWDTQLDVVPVLRLDEPPPAAPRTR